MIDYELINPWRGQGWVLESKCVIERSNKNVSVGYHFPLPLSHHWINQHNAMISHALISHTALERAVQTVLVWRHKRMRRGGWGRNFQKSAPFRQNFALSWAKYFVNNGFFVGQPPRLFLPYAYAWRSLNEDFYY